MKTIKPFDGIVGGMSERESLTTSLHIADVFGKRHDNVLRDINNISDKTKHLLNIEEVFYKDDYDRKQKCYRLEKDACAFIVFGFSGEKAEEFKDQGLELYQ